MAENIKVAVRVRPFNDREKKNGSKLIVKMSGQATEVIHPQSTQPPKKFNFNHSYWSFDGYSVREDGYHEPKDGHYADQERVYNDLGKGMLENAWQGYNASIFAYGQTGSGKSYSIMGYSANKGIVPRICEDLFTTMDQRKTEGMEYQVSFSMIEIYNESVRDLLSKKRKPDGGLSIRESPEKGFYVEGLEKVPVSSAEDIQLRINQGDRQRTLAATKMNETSSRAHTLVTVYLLQKNRKSNRVKQSVINLVDLAGSERNKQSQTTGDRFEESKNINQSLMTLGTVIRELYEKKTHVQFRNSKLTKLLKNAIGGNSKTIMMATISPSDENYEQTLSTLKYASQAIYISNKAVVNEKRTDEVIQQLLLEKEALLKELNEARAGIGSKFSGYTEEEIQELKEKQEEEINRYKLEMNDMESSWQKKLDEQRAEKEKLLQEARREKEDRQQKPHIWNLNEDPALTGKVYYVAKPGETRVGNRRSLPEADIILHGPSVAKQHAILKNDARDVTILPGQGRVLVNGEELKKPRKLKHQDRLFFGSANIFVFHHPKEEEVLKSKGKLLAITHDFAQQEIASSSGIDVSSEDGLLQQEVLSILPSVMDANAIATHLQKKVQFYICLISGTARGQQGSRTELFVKVKNTDEKGFEFMWSRVKFINRLDVMRTIYRKFEDGLDKWDVENKEDDPFWEPDDSEVMIGVVYVPLESLGHMLDFDDHLNILDYTAQQRGHLVVKLCPCKADGREPPSPDDLFVEEPIDLIGTDVAFKVKIEKALNLNQQFSKIWCRYKLLEGQGFTTSEKKNDPSCLDFSNLHIFKTITQKQVEFLQNETIAIQVWGCQGTPSYSKPSSAINRQAPVAKNVPVPLDPYKADNDQLRLLKSEVNTWKKKAEKYQQQLVFSWAIAQYYMSVTLSDWLRETPLQNMDAPIEFVILIQKPNFNLNRKIKDLVNKDPASDNSTIKGVKQILES